MLLSIFEFLTLIDIPLVQNYHDFTRIVSNTDLGEMSVRELAKLVTFVLLTIGTIGLLINEFIFDWGRAATLTFAVFNFVGLAILAFVTWGIRKET